MGTPLHKLPAGEKVPDILNAVIEVHRGCRVRYMWDMELEAFRLLTVLERGGEWPADYGFVPSTVSQDGYPLDIIVMAEEPTFPGAIITCRPVAMLNLTYRGLVDHKILAVPLTNPRYDDVKDLEDLPAGTTELLTGFFAANPNLTGEPESVEGWENAETARDVTFKAWQAFLI